MARASNVRKLTILAQDPAVRFGGPDGPLAFAEVDVPSEILAAGPTGYRVKVVDYDASSQVLYLDRIYASEGARPTRDPFAFPKNPTPAQRAAHEAALLADPNFHSQNVYAIVMRTLTRFEFALGRRIAWSFGGHQLNVIPHAFGEANAFYSEEDHALFFGYFPGRSGQMVFTCLSHDVVAHETTHALLDGLRTGFTELSMPDQAAFHEAFADIVALLSVFSLPEIVGAALSDAVAPKDSAGEIPLIEADRVTLEALRQSVLTGVAKEFGKELVGHGDEVSEVRGAALRNSVRLEPGRAYLEQDEYQEEHRRGEILVAAFMRAFLSLWRRRIEGLGTFEGRYNRDMVVEEGAKAADHLLTMAIRALDYCPPTDIDFSAYLAALLTADAEVVPDDRRGYRATLRRVFASYGIDPPAAGCQPDGAWRPFKPPPSTRINYARSNFESMLRDRDEVFRFIWENRNVLNISERVPIEVASLNPSIRQGPDGLLERETVVTYIQRLDMFAAECAALLGFERPAGMSTRQRLQVFGGGTLIFDQYGRVKYHIVHSIRDMVRQRRRLEYLAGIDATVPRRGMRDRFAALHRARAED